MNIMSRMRQLFHRLLCFFSEEKNKKFVFYMLMWGLTGIAAFFVIKAKVYDEIVPYATYLENTDEEQFIRNLTSGMTIEQEFTSPHDFECLTLSCSNHEKVLPGRMIVEIKDHEQNTIVSQIIDNASVTYGVPVEIHFEGEKDKPYVVTVIAVNTEEEAIGFFGYIPEEEADTATVDGRKSEYALSVGTHIHTGIFYRLLWIVMLILFLGMMIMIWFFSRREPEPQSMFLLLAIPMGIALLCFMSVNFINDGDAHFTRAYLYANIALGVADQDTISTITMRKDDLDTFYSSACQNARNAQNMCHIYENWSWFVKDETLINNVECRSAGNTSAFAYLPSILAILLARILKLGTYPMLYLAKIFPFICYLLGGYHAIKKTPVGKHVMVFLLALPIAMQQAVGITYDNMTYMILFLLISYVLKIYFEGMDKKEGVILAILCLLLGSCKGGAYTPMLFMLLFLPKDKMGGLKKKFIYILGVGALTLCMTLAGYGSTILSYIQPKTATMAEESAESELQGIDNEQEALIQEPPTEKYGILYALRSPMGFVKLMGKTIIDRTEYYIDGLTGRMVAWAVEQLPVWSCGLFGIILILAKNGIAEEKYRIDWKLRVGMLSTFLIILVTFLVLFLIETPNHYPYIWGIQGRYFLPQVMLLLLAIRNNHVTQEKNTESLLYLLYYAQMIFFMIGYFGVFMTQTYH